MEWSILLVSTDIRFACKPLLRRCISNTCALKNWKRVNSLTHSLLFARAETQIKYELRFRSRLRKIALVLRLLSISSFQIILNKGLGRHSYFLLVVQVSTQMHSQTVWQLKTEVKEKQACLWARSSHVLFLTLGTHEHTTTYTNTHSAQEGKYPSAMW